MDTGTLRVKLPPPPPASPPRGPGRFTIPGVLVLALLLTGFGVFRLAERSDVGRPQASPVSARPGEQLELLDSPVTADGRFLDPVTREQVDPATAPYQADLYGTTFYFASRSSFDRFRQEPLKFVRARVKVQIQLTPEAPGGEGAPGPALEESPGLTAPPDAVEETAPLPEPWEESTDAPPAVEAGPPGPAGPGQDPGWLPVPGAASPAPAGPGDDVILQPVGPATAAPVPDEGDVILDEGTPAPAGPPTPLRR